MTNDWNNQPNYGGDPNFPGQPAPGQPVPGQPMPGQGMPGQQYQPQGYAPDQNPPFSGYDQYQGPPPKQGMSTGAKIGIGIGVAVLGLGALALLGNFLPTSVFNLEVGDCIETFDAFEGTAEVDSLKTVDCAEPHALEVYHEVEAWGEDVVFPGSGAIETVADEACFQAFEPFVGTSFDTSELYFTYLTPSESSWEQDDREVTCLLFIPEQTLTGTMRGSGR